MIPLDAHNASIEDLYLLLVCDHDARAKPKGTGRPNSIVLLLHVCWGNRVE